MTSTFVTSICQRCRPPSCSRADVIDATALAFAPSRMINQYTPSQAGYPNSDPHVRSMLGSTFADCAVLVDRHAVHDAEAAVPRQGHVHLQRARDVGAQRRRRTQPDRLSPVHAVPAEQPPTNALLHWLAGCVLGAAHSTVSPRSSILTDDSVQQRRGRLLGHAAGRRCLRPHLGAARARLRC